MGKKPRKNKLNPRELEVIRSAGKKKERDWTFEDIARSKTRRR